MKKQLLFIVLLLSFTLPLGAFPQWPKQTAQKLYQLPWYAAPQVKAGYTFRAGFYWGWSIDIGLQKYSFGSLPLRYGYSFGRSRTSAYSGRYEHRMKTRALVLETNMGGLRMGVTKIRNYKAHRKSCYTYGISTDAYVFLPSQIYPVIGFQRVIYRPSSWAWFDGPYKTIYGGVGARSYLHSTSRTVAPLFPSW